MQLDISALVRAFEARTDENAFTARLSADDWQTLGQILERRELQTGELLLQRGSTGEVAFLIESGALQVFVVGGPPGSHRIALLQEGTVVGEPGLFAAVQRLAHVEATTACIVWALRAEQLRALASMAPRVAFEVLRAAGALMAQRVRAYQERGIPVT